MSLSEVTDPHRRLATQIAIQLPENVAEAHRVLDLAGECIDDFLVEPSPARRRAGRLGWGVDVAVATLAPAPMLRRARIWPTLLALSTLALSLPVATLMVGLFGIGAGVTFMFAVTIVALLVGTVPALVLSAVTALLHNLFVVPPALEFSRPTAAEIVMAGCYLLISFVIPWLATRRERIRTALIQPGQAARANPPLRRVG